MRITIDIPDDCVGILTNGPSISQTLARAVHILDEYATEHCDDEEKCNEAERTIDDIREIWPPIGVLHKVVRDAMIRAIHFRDLDRKEHGASF